jgi:alkylation response protein AidB-like acyl-CoA dehydrogenase
VPRETPGLSVERLSTVDDTRRIGELIFDDLRVDRSMQLAEAKAGAIERIIDAGRIALAADALGACERALERAVAYSLDRKQFERVIGSFQAVKHMCAEVAADIEPLRSLVWYAAFAWDDGRDDAAAVAASLKALAGDTGVRATTTCVEVFGGMGFTWECDAHLWFKRAGYDRQMLGGPAEMRARAADLTLSRT